MFHLASTALQYLAVRQNPVAYARDLGVQIGSDCRLIAITPSTFGSEPFLVQLGDHVTVTAGVRFITHDGGVWVFRQSEPDIELFGPISVGNNVFIGVMVTLMPGVTIGDNVVVGAGAIVTRDIPSNSVAVGTPARVIKSVTQYRASVETRVTHSRSLPLSEKRRFLRTRYGDHR